MGTPHTPGPWKVEPAIGSNNLVVGLYVEPKVGDKYRGSICSLHDAENIGGIAVVERDSNARLIAAAPDLLAALQFCVKYDGGECLADHPRRLAAARAAIAKATKAAP